MPEGISYIYIHYIYIYLYCIYIYTIYIYIYIIHIIYTYSILYIQYIYDIIYNIYIYICIIYTHLSIHIHCTPNTSRPCLEACLWRILRSLATLDPEKETPMNTPVPPRALPRRIPGENSFCVLLSRHTNPSFAGD